MVLDSSWPTSTARPRQETIPIFIYRLSGINYVPKEEWKDVYVYRNGCIADGKCEVLARGKVWLDNEAMPDASRVSGKYEIELNGQHLRGQFPALLPSASGELFAS